GERQTDEIVAAVQKQDLVRDRLGERADEAVRLVRRRGRLALQSVDVGGLGRERADREAFDAEAVAARRLRTRVREELMRLRRRRILEHKYSEMTRVRERALRGHATERERRRRVRG